MPIVPKGATLTRVRPKMTGYLTHLNTGLRTNMAQAKHTPSDADTAPTSYEAALKELEGLVQQMESGQLPLADLLSGYQRGAALLGYCRAQLDAVEQQIKVLDNGAMKSWTPT
jgi:exodeoxyribonuclease VII small subunit